MKMDVLEELSLVAFQAAKMGSLTAFLKAKDKGGVDMRQIKAEFETATAQAENDAAATAEAAGGASVTEGVRKAAPVAPKRGRKWKVGRLWIEGGKGEKEKQEEEEQKRLKIRPLLEAAISPGCHHNSNNNNHNYFNHNDGDDKNETTHIDDQEDKKQIDDVSLRVALTTSTQNIQGQCLNEMDYEIHYDAEDDKDDDGDGDDDDDAGMEGIEFRRKNVQEKKQNSRKISFDSNSYCSIRSSIEMPPSPIPMTTTTAQQPSQQQPQQQQQPPQQPFLTPSFQSETQSTTMTPSWTESSSSYTPLHYGTKPGHFET